MAIRVGQASLAHGTGDDEELSEDGDEGAGFTQSGDVFDKWS